MTAPPSTAELRPTVAGASGVIGCSPVPSRRRFGRDLQRALCTQATADLPLPEPDPHDRGASLSRGRSSVCSCGKGIGRPRANGCVHAPPRKPMASTDHHDAERAVEEGWQLPPSPARPSGKPACGPFGIGLCVVSMLLVFE